MAADVGRDVMLARAPCSTSFIAAKIGRSGQPVQKPGGRGGTPSASAFTFGWASIGAGSGTGGGCATARARGPQETHACH